LNHAAAADSNNQIGRCGARRRRGADHAHIRAILSHEIEGAGVESAQLIDDPSKQVRPL